MQQQVFIKSNSSKRIGWMDFLAFRKLATVRIISFVWVAGSLLITSGGLIFLLENKLPVYHLIPGGGVLIFGNILWRMWCELIILLLRISRSLARIEINTSHELSHSGWMN